MPTGPLRMKAREPQTETETGETKRRRQGNPSCLRPPGIDNAPSRRHDPNKKTAGTRGRCAAARLGESASYLAKGAPLPWRKPGKPPAPKRRPISISYAIRCVSFKRSCCAMTMIALQAAALSPPLPPPQLYHSARALSSTNVRQKWRKTRRFARWTERAARVSMVPVPHGQQPLSCRFQRDGF